MARHRMCSSFSYFRAGGGGGEKTILFTCNFKSNCLLVFSKLRKIENDVCRKKKNVGLLGLSFFFSLNLLLQQLYLLLQAQALIYY